MRFMLLFQSATFGMTLSKIRISVMHPEIDRSRSGIPLLGLHFQSHRSMVYKLSFNDKYVSPPRRIM